MVESPNEDKIGTEKGDGTWNPLSDGLIFNNSKEIPVTLEMFERNFFTDVKNIPIHLSGWLCTCYSSI